MDKSTDTAGRRSRAYWHPIPKDDGWKACTLEHYQHSGDKLEPTCRNCWHKGAVMTGAEVADWAGVPMDTPITALAARMVCSRCDHPAGYFHVHNSDVRSNR